MVIREKRAEAGPTATGEDVVRGQMVGMVASPSGSEATSDEFVFWSDESKPIEKTQHVRVESHYGERCIVFHAVVDEVYRRSRRRDVLEEADRYGLDPNTRLPLDSQGVTYARAKILSAAPNVLMPPREESGVYLAEATDVSTAYGFGEISEPLLIGLLKNGGDDFAGPAQIDLDYLLGGNGAHINVNGIAGVASKSSFLLVVLSQLLRYCDTQARNRPSSGVKRAVVPVILNVKGFDLMWLDRRNVRYTGGEEDAVWREMGVNDPAPFVGARFLAPQQAGSRTAIPVGRDVGSYSWSLSDVVRGELFPFLFGDEDREDENFLALVQDIEAHITFEPGRSGSDRPQLREGAPRTFQDLVDWVGAEAAAKEDVRSLKNHHQGTWRKLHRRLRRIVVEGDGVLVRYGYEGTPLDVTATETGPPVVVDIQGIQDAALQRFVVAAIFKQVSEARTGTNAVPNLSYVLLIDELNRWAPRGGKDAITRLVEKVVAEMRSQGIILFGAQQQASQVSPRVIENSAIRVLGRTGSLELSHDIWGFLDRSVKRTVENLPISEKIVHEVNFRRPMHVRCPQPRWAMRRDEAAPASVGGRFSEQEKYDR